MTKKIALLRELSKDQIKKIKEIAPSYQLVKGIEDEDKKEIEIVFGWNNELKDWIENAGEQLNWIQYVYAGVNHLPLDLLKKKEIKLTSGSGSNARAVAESTMAVVLGFSRNIVKAVREQEKRNWFIPEKNIELRDKKIIIVGAGKIGEEIGQLAKAFSMHTIGINRSGGKIPYMDEQYVQNDLEKIIHQADFIVNVLPVTEQTKKFFNHRFFSKMNETSIFINVGRGETVVTADLMKVLDKKEIAGAALDVFEEEPLPTNHPLWTYDNVIITPHIAGNVEDELENVFPLFLENLAAYVQSEDFPHNKIDWEQGY
ncbi:MAG: hydroxyacid dehydrogenase [Atopostipes suicloacalis]|nr:hydroxyacid dehydrogenase [Atopostipes suicloacalis]